MIDRMFSRSSVAAVALLIAACNPSAPTEPPEAATNDGATQDGTGQDGTVSDGSGAGGTGEQIADGTGAVAQGSGDAAGTGTAPVVDEPVDVTAADGYGPLSPEAHALFWGSTEDPPAEQLLATRPDLEGRHYLTCDENNHHLLYDRIQNLGGGYAGVGSDQAYMFIGWQRPNLAWLTDYDPWIRHLHWAYHAFFRASEDPETFRAWWDDDREDDAEALIRQTYPERDDVDDIVFVFREARNGIQRRLRRLRGIQLDADIPSFISDQDDYTFVRDLIIAGRVRPMIGNLMDDEGLLGVAEVGRELEVPMRLYYLSNAEDYWDYPDQFRANFAGTYFDERSLVLRTDAKKRRNDDYAYCLQPGLNFQEWLAQPYVIEVSDIWPRERVRDRTHIPIRFLDEAPFDRNPDED